MDDEAESEEEVGVEREKEGEGTRLRKLTLDVQACQHLHHLHTVKPKTKKQKRKLARSHIHTYTHHTAHHTDAKRGRVRVGLYALANDYPRDYQLTAKVQLLECLQLFQRWCKCLGTSSAEIVVWGMYAHERRGEGGLRVRDGVV